ncbi:MAG: PTS sugar transporter subunit IIA [Spirochaeta sp.]|nr:PTS sugar transporter subunit IIA [Spirochaeta sp.]
MNLKKLLNRDNILLELKSEEKVEIIEEMVDLLVKAGKVEDKQAALQVVLEREKKMSTGLAGGLAVPHGKTDSVKELVVALALKKEGLDFASLDGSPSRIFIMTISPASHSGPHIQFLAEISRLLNREDVRNAVLQAESADQVIKALS